MPGVSRTWLIANTSFAVRSDDATPNDTFVIDPITLKKILLAFAIITLSMTSCYSPSRTLALAPAGSAVDKGRSGPSSRESDVGVARSNKAMEDAKANERFEATVWWFELIAGFIRPAICP